MCRHVIPRYATLIYNDTAEHKQISIYQRVTFAGAVYYNAQASCATRLCCACVDETDCVAAEYLTLHRGREMGAHCAPLR